MQISMIRVSINLVCLCLTTTSTASNEGLSGTIPSEIGKLTALTELWLCKYLILQGSNGSVEAFNDCLTD